MTKEIGRIIGSLIVAMGLLLLTACGASPVAVAPPSAPSPSATSPAPTLPSATPLSITPMVGTAIAGTAVVGPPLGTPAGTPIPPTPTPAAVVSGTPVAERTVTLADQGKTVELQVGQRFLLALDPGWEWTITIADSTVVSRIANITVVQGAQGVYEAKKPGRTTLNATGDLPCRKAQPPCMAPTRVFEVELVVR